MTSSSTSAMREARSRSDTALSGSLRRTDVPTPIPDTGDLTQLEENVAAASLRLGDDEHDLLLALG
jgi:aryl-alcohol dehydrogenase-like predicted oxidoreductase